MPRQALSRTMIALALFFAATGIAGRARAQFGPPSTFLGTVADEQGVITPGMPVQAYVGDTLCSLPSGGPNDSITFPYGEGSGKVVFYIVDVVSAEQRGGCGRDGAEVRIRIGDRFANETGRWRAGLVRLDVTFGDVEPAVQPTATQTPQDESVTSAPGTPPAAAASPGTDQSGGGVGAVSTATPTQAGAVARPGALRSSADATSYGDGDGFPVWGILLIGLAILGVAGGVIGVLAARREPEERP